MTANEGTQGEQVERWCERDQRFFNAREWELHRQLCPEHQARTAAGMKAKEPPMTNPEPTEPRITTRVGRSADGGNDPLPEPAAEGRGWHVEDSFEGKILVKNGARMNIYDTKPYLNHVEADLAQARRDAEFWKVRYSEVDDRAQRYAAELAALQARLAEVEKVKP